MRKKSALSTTLHKHLIDINLKKPTSSVNQLTKGYYPHLAQLLPPLIFLDRNYLPACTCSGLSILQLHV